MKNFARLFPIVILALLLFSCTGAGPMEPMLSNGPNPDMGMNSDAYDPGTGWTLSWSDEFSGSSVDTTKWNFDTGGGGWGNNELEYYTARTQNASVANGFLSINAVKESYNGSSFTSARLQTQGKFSARFGKVAARIKLPYGKGIWPAFWMLGDGFNGSNWPNCAEIDLMEMKGGFDNILYSTCHWSSNSTYIYKGTVYTNTEAFYLNYHVFEIQWDTNQIQWKLDGVTYYTLNISQRSMSAFEFPFFIILNVAVGGNFFSPAITDPAQVTATMPQTMSVDWVRVYSPNFTLPAGPSGSQDVSVYSETHTGYNVLATGATIDNWNNTVTLAQNSAFASEGTTGLQVTVGSQGWMGFGVSAYNLGTDLSAYANSSLKFDIKTTSQKAYKVGIKSASTTEGWVNLTSAMGYVPDGQWHTVTIPISSFTGVKLNMISQYFMFSAVNGSQAGDVIYVDNIYWQKTSGGSSSSVSSVVSSSVSSAASSSSSSVATGDYSYGVDTVNSTTAKIWFKSNTSPAAVWANVHYKVNGGGQQNFSMTYNSSTARYEQTVTGLSAASTVSYSFTYEKSGLAYDSTWYSYIFQGTGSSSVSSVVSSSSVSSAASSVSSIVSSASSSSGTDYTYGVTVTGTTAVIWFKSNTSPAALWVDVHYKLNGGGQQNFRMTYNTSTARWEQTITGVSAGSALNYNFTYEKSGLAYDTAWFAYNAPAGDYLQGVTVVSSSQVTIWFQSLTSPAALWVDVHYKVNGGGQQNFRMTYNMTTARWEQTVTGLVTGNTVNYYNTYEKSGLAYDTGWTLFTK